VTRTRPRQDAARDAGHHVWIRVDRQTGRDHGRGARGGDRDGRPDEHRAAHVQPIIRVSKKLIDDSRFEIQNMPKMKRIPKPENAIMKRGDYSGQGPMIELE